MIPEQTFFDPNAVVGMSHGAPIHGKLLARGMGLEKIPSSHLFGEGTGRIKKT